MLGFKLQVVSRLVPHWHGQHLEYSLDYGSTLRYLTLHLV